MTYIDQARSALAAQGFVLPRELADLYVLLTLVKGEAVTREDVHDAWSVWRSTTDPRHRAIVPFSELTKQVQEQDEPYLAAIVAAAGELE